MTNQFIEGYRSDVLKAFCSYKKLAERALEQVSIEEYFQAIDKDSNSLAVIVKHISGNLLSRWTDFLTSDGEKKDRDRDSEFICESDTQEFLEAFWEAGWRAVISTLECLRPVDFSRIVKIRDEDLSVAKAINRSLSHTAYHVGQIVFLAKFFCGSEWRSLSIPRGQSNEFNESLAERLNESCNAKNAENLPDLHKNA